MRRKLPRPNRCTLEQCNLLAFVLGNCYKLLSCEVYEYLLLVILRTSDLQPKSERSRMFRNQRERTINLHAKFSRLRVSQISKLWSKLSGAGRWRTVMMSLRLKVADTQAAARRGEGKAEPCCRSRSVEMASRTSWRAVRLLAWLCPNLIMRPNSPLGEFWFSQSLLINFAGLPKIPRVHIVGRD